MKPPLNYLMQACGMPHWTERKYHCQGKQANGACLARDSDKGLSCVLHASRLLDVFVSLNLGPRFEKWTGTLRPALPPPDLSLIEPMSMSISCINLRPVDHRSWLRRLPHRPICIVHLCKLCVLVA